ncbi:putative class I glutamine amidotransferase-like protein [Lyophyllum shimeji]|uniref:Class I glutamine amidotransferase-like protein n=1 Tax=Lyophyllum shimeji TaxID=47721 RepID=A0A9P3PT54_LYOSH|nr:putative class I glutamine amidotransferase-like protein [Lyophyllum shimeji]
MPKKIALLISGSLPENLQATYGDYGAVFKDFLRRSLPKDDVGFTLDPYDVVKLEYPSDDQLDSYDGIMYTGSAASAYEDVEWINRLVAFTARVVNEKPHIKVLGICFGHQIVARALGGEVVPNNGLWEVGPTPLDLTDLGRRLFGVETLNIQQMHRDHVPVVPPTFELLGSTSVSHNQGMVRFAPGTEFDQRTLDNVHIITLQGHPEFDEGIVSGIVEARTKSGVIGAEVAADAERRKAWRNDGIPILGKALWGVLGVKA